MKVFLVSLIVLLTFSSCVPEPDIDLGECPSSEDISNNDTTTSVASGRKIAQELSMNGLLGASVFMNRLRLYMSSNNLTQVNIAVYKDSDANPHVHHPEDGIIIGTTSLTSGLGSSDPTTEHDFYFSSPVEFEVGEDYFFIVEGVGGDFDISIASPGLLTTNSIYVHNGTSWTTPFGYDPNISFDVFYSHCEGF